MAAKTKKKPAAKRSAADRYATQVSAETTLKFGPEDSQLAQALRDAESTYSSDRKAASGTRRAIEEAAKTSKPKFAKDVKVARSDVTKTQGELDANLKSLPNAGGLAGAARRDSEGTERRLSEMLANAQLESDTRARDAVTGEAYAKSAAKGRLEETKTKIAQRLSDQAVEKGAFQQARSGELVEAARGRSVTRRGQDKAADTARRNRVTQNKNADQDRASREKIAADQAKGKGRQTPEKTEAAKTNISRALEQASRLKDKDKLDRPTAAKALVNGRPGQTIKQAPKDMKMPDGTEYKAGDTLQERHVAKVPEVKATEQVWASVALDLAYDGHLSTANMRKLQAMGYSVKDLGLKTAGRSGTKEAKEKARNGSPNPVKPKPLPSGVGALIPSLRRP